MKILVGTDGSEHSTLALLDAIRVAKKFSGSIKVIIVYTNGMTKEAEKILKEAEHQLKQESIEYHLSAIMGSNPSRALVNRAKHEQFDLIVVGSRGLSSAEAFLLGSVSRKVVIEATCDVLVVKK